LKEIDEKELEKLNKEVTLTIKKRTAWLESKMVEYSELQVGDDIYNLSTGEKLGVVSKIYECWTKEKSLDDVNLMPFSPDLEYEYEVPISKHVLNTLRQPRISVGTKREAILWANDRSEVL